MNYLYMQELEAGKVYKILSRTHYSELNGLNVIFLRKEFNHSDKSIQAVLNFLCTYYFVINGKVTGLQSNYGTLFEPIHNNP